jgi:uncharacterized protein DUF2877
MVPDFRLAAVALYHVACGTMIGVTALGWRAEAALRAGAGRARVVAALSRSLYAEAAGELVWVGDPGGPLHARAVLGLDLPRGPAGATIQIDVAGAAPWRPDVGPLDPTPMLRAARLLHTRLETVGIPRGFGRLLVADGDDAVTARARPHAVALAAACDRGDGGGIADAATPLLGLGDGFTPSGDDYVGGALFALHSLGRDVVRDPRITALVAAAHRRTHPISARLLADLAAGEGWASLHELTRALARDASAVTAAARSVIVLGHSSGWDLLAGVLTVLVGAGAIGRSGVDAKVRIGSEV